MRKTKLIWAVFFLLIFSVPCFAELGVRSYAVELVAEYRNDPVPSIHLSWINDTSANKYIISRKLLDDSDWIEIAVLPEDASEFIDFDVVPQTPYEYQVNLYGSDHDGWGYVIGGYNLDTPKQRTALLLIDDSLPDIIPKEIDRFKEDIVGSGYRLISRVAPRSEQFDKNKVQATKDIIKQVFAETDGTLTTLILLGRIAVPYSGDIQTDGHPDHKGAWAADTYYADIDGIWTDTSVVRTTADSSMNHNVIGDGKWDNSIMPSRAELELGRIDLYGLPAYPDSEIELLRRYLQKNHNYRQLLSKHRMRAIVDDRFGDAYDEKFGSNAWLNFPPLLSRDSIEEGSIRYGIQEDSYLWAYGCNSGGHSSMLNIIYSEEMDSINYNAVFMLMLGSYLGDWNAGNNVMRAAIASNPSILTCAWSGRPFWHFHHMGIGEPIGLSAKIAMNNNLTYQSSGKYGYRGIHIGLMGDPTLTMYIVEPPGQLTRSSTHYIGTTSTVELAWSKSSDSIINGYNVYRIESTGIQTKLNLLPVVDTVFVDFSPIRGINNYLIRTEKSIVSSSANFRKESQGIFAKAFVPNINSNLVSEGTLEVYPNPANESIQISFTLTEGIQSDLVIYDFAGRLIKSFKSANSPGQYDYYWDLTDSMGNTVASGIYIAVVSNFFNSMAEKIIVNY